MRLSAVPRREYIFITSQLDSVPSNRKRAFQPPQYSMQTRQPCVASTRKATRIVISHFPQPFCFLLPFQHFEQLDLLQENNYMAFGLRP